SVRAARCRRCAVRAGWRVRRRAAAVIASSTRRSVSGLRATVPGLRSMFGLRALAWPRLTLSVMSGLFGIYVLLVHSRAFAVVTGTSSLVNAFGVRNLPRQIEASGILGTLLGTAPTT